MFNGTTFLLIQCSKPSDGKPLRSCYKSLKPNIRGESWKTLAPSMVLPETSQRRFHAKPFGQCDLLPRQPYQAEVIEARQPAGK